MGAVVALPQPAALRLAAGKLVIDTDGGADDAMALMVALGQQQLEQLHEIVAITCVRGNVAVDNVAVNVLKTLDVAGRLDIPVYRGAEGSLLVSPPTDHYFGQDGLGDFKYPSPPDHKQFLKKEHAVNALIRIVSTHPGEVTVLCLGPLTNIALAIRLDPLFLTKVRQLVVLGGSVEGVGNVRPGVEFNFYIDPEATFVVFNSTDVENTKIHPVILIPWESIAMRNKVSIDWRVNVLGKLGSKKMNFLNQAERLVLNYTTWSTADSLACAVAMNPSIVTSTRTEYLVIDPFHTSDTRGAAFVDYQDSLKRRKNVIIVGNVNVDNFKKMLVNNLS